MAEVSVSLDLWLGPQLTESQLGVSPEGLRSFLATVASGLITLAALVFSTTLVALTLASSQFGPRLLHNFIRARANQITLGVLVGTFLFCVIVLRSGRADVLPYYSALVAFALTLASLALFLYFVHHLVRSLQAENIVESVAGQLLAAIEAVFPEAYPSSRDEEQAEESRENWDELQNETSVETHSAGYLQFIDTATLLQLASQESTRIRAMARPGQLLLDKSYLFAYERSEPLSEEQEQQFLGCFIVGQQRTPDQDFEFEFRQLVEVGVRALSPGINDPFTAVNCIDLLAIALGRIAQRKIATNTFYDEDGVPRLRLRPTSFRNLLETAFLQLRHDGAGRPDIALRLFEVLLMLAEHARNGEQLEAIDDFGSLLLEEALDRSRSAYDRERFEDAHSELQARTADMQATLAQSF
jgi:uncharacterized membrane protein